MNCVMMVTRSCNLNCKYCYMDANEADYKIEHEYSIIDMLEHLETIKIDKLIIGGGEPLLREDIFKILKKSVATVSTSILTNGTLINQKVAKKLKETGIQGISISLDSPYPEIHDQYRDDSFDLVSEALKLCVKEEIDVDIGVCLTKKNFMDSLKLIEMAEDMNLKSITFEGLNPVGRAKECESLE
ncbi:MAG: radical SAM protein, partial [Methanobacterium sp.]